MPSRRRAKTVPKRVPQNSAASGKVAIVIAAYNERARLGPVVQGVIKAGYPWVIVVDDGSTDSTSAVATRAGADTLRHPINRGQGAALRTGIDYALEHGADFIVTYDADGQFVPEDIPAILLPVTSGRVDVALGSRFLGKAIGIGPGKKFVLKLGALVTLIFSGVRLSDSHNGLRCLSRGAAQAIRIRFDRMEHASEIIDEIAKHRLRYEEVPVTVIYHEAGQHPLRSIKMGLKLVFWKVFGW